MDLKWSNEDVIEVTFRFNVRGLTKMSGEKNGIATIFTQPLNFHKLNSNFTN